MQSGHKAIDHTHKSYVEWKVDDTVQVRLGHLRLLCFCSKEKNLFIKDLDKLHLFDFML